MNLGFDLAGQIREKMGSASRAALITGFLAGFVTHIFMITNKLPNWDDLMCTPDVGGGAYFGRWLEYSTHLIFNRWSAPGINGTMAVLFLAIAAAFITAFLRIRTVTGGVLCGLLIVTFPAAASNMTYMYIAAIYAMAIAIICGGVLLTGRLKHGWIFGIIGIVLSLAIYQAYFSFAAALFILGMLADLLDGEDTIAVIRKGFLYLFTLAAGIACYLLSVRLSGYEMTSYKGLDTIGQTDAASYLHAVLRTWHRFLQYFVTAPESYMQGASHTVSLVTMAVLAVLALYLFVQRAFYKKPLTCILYLVLLVLMPFAMAIVYLMAPDIQHASSVMTYAYVIVYVMMIVFAERAESPENTGKESGAAGNGAARLLAAAASLMLFVTAFMNYRIDNAAYYRSYISKERVTDLAVRILAGVEAQEGYEAGDRVMIVGNAWNFDNASTHLVMDEDMFRDMEGIATENGLFMPVNRARFYETYLGVKLNEVTPEEIGKIRATKEFQAMPDYPGSGSIQKIEGFWVVRLSDEE